VPAEFDALVRRATARDPADRYADADEMSAELHDIVDELELPAFRVPAPRNSAQHLAATRVHSRQDAPAEMPAPPTPQPAPPRQLTRELTRDQDWAPVGDYPEYSSAATKFAGIEMSEFYWAQQRAKRALVFWVIAVLTFTGLVAAAAWTLGSHVAALI
jgi:serine/threonine-protein kinase